MTRKAIGAWMESGSITKRFFKSAALNFMIAFTLYTLIDWKAVIAHRFMLEDLWVTAACFALGFGLVDAERAIDKARKIRQTVE
jgi:hypothetical protein